MDGCFCSAGSEELPVKAAKDLDSCCRIDLLLSGVLLVLAGAALTIWTAISANFSSEDRHGGQT
jgi:hypothetical protein